MRTSFLPLTFLLILAGTLAAESDWPQWRGPLATGVSPDADPPITWSVDASPAAAGKELFLRGHESLYCLSGE